MKILFISKYLFNYQFKGIQTRLQTLVSEFKKNNHEVSVICSKPNLKKKGFELSRIDKVDYFILYEKNNYKFNSFKRVFAWINFEFKVLLFNYNYLKFKPNIVYISSPSLITIINGIILKKKFNCKLVFEMRDFWPLFLIHSGKFSKFNPLIILLNFVEKIGIKFSDLIVSLMPRIKDYLKYRNEPNKVFFASTFPFVKNTLKLKKKNNLSINKTFFNIAYAGNFGHDNYLDDLLELIANLKTKIFFFHLIGEGSLKEQLIDKYKNIKNVRFIKHISYQNLNSVLKQMDANILSFGFANNYPKFGYELNKLNNYLMSEKPIICIGKKTNLNKSRGEFIFVERKIPKLFEAKLVLVKKNYNFFKAQARINKINFIKRNNINTVYSQLEIQLLKILN